MTAAISGVFVDTVEQSRRVCGKLLGDAASGLRVDIAVDLEGRDLSAVGAIAIVTVATSANQVYLFDFAEPAIAKKLLAEGQLKDVLQHKKIQKFMFDCRMDSSALYHQYGVALESVVDLQVAACMHIAPGGRYLIGMKKAFARFHLMTEEDETCKAKGIKIFAPELGGSYEAWFTRPMMPQMMDYCVVDVKHFFAAATKMINGAAMQEKVTRASRTRVAATQARQMLNCGPERDF